MSKLHPSYPEDHVCNMSHRVIALALVQVFLSTWNFLEMPRRSKRNSAGTGIRRSARKRARQDADRSIYGDDFGILPSD